MPVEALGSVDVVFGVSVVVVDELLSDLDSVPFESDLLSDFGSDELFESEAADFLYDSLR